MMNLYVFTDAGQTTPIVNHSDGTLSSVRSRRVEGTTEATLYNATALSSSSTNLNNIAVLRNQSDVLDSTTQVSPHYLEICPSKVHCDKLGADCIDCEFNSTCRYGANVTAVCHAKPQIICLVGACSVLVFPVWSWASNAPGLIC